MNRVGVSMVVMAWYAALSGCAAPPPPGGMTASGYRYPAPTPARLQAAGERAFRILQRMTASDEPPARANAIEALSTTVGAAAGRYYLRGLDDSVVNVRFASAMAVGDTRYRPAAGRLRDMLGSEPDANVRAGVIYALYRLGDGTVLKGLGRLLVDDAPEVRANAALVIGMVGLGQGIEPLLVRSGIEEDPGVKMQIAESLAMLGNAHGFALLRNYARVGEPYQQVQAVISLGRSGNYSDSAGILTWAVASSYAPPQRIAAAGALGRLGDSSAFDMVVAAVEQPRKFCEVTCGQSIEPKPVELMQLKQLSALAFGDIGRTLALGYLEAMLESDQSPVRVAAARSILMLAVAETRRAAAGRAADGRATGPSASDLRPRTAPIKR